MAAGIPAGETFSELTWTEAFRVASNGGTAQSMVATDDYIIVVTNMADDKTVKDVVTAYYRNDVDENGTPVTRYSVAKTLQNDHLERGNGMAYNPTNNTVYVAPSTCYDSTNYGCLLKLDPSTLTLTGTEFLTYECGINGVSYDALNDRYIIQGNHDNNYKYQIYDSNFNFVSDLGSTDITPGYAAQDFAVCGDYIINSPAMESADVPYLNIYSISGCSKVNTIQMNIPLDDLISVEPQSVTELNAGELMVMVNETNTAGENFTVFYVTEVPYNYSITTQVTNGTITETSSEVSRGTNFKVEFQANKGYELAEIIVDGNKLNPDSYSNSYTFEDISDNHSIIITYGEEDEVRKQSDARQKACNSITRLLKKTVGGGFTVVKLILGIILVAVAAFLILLCVALIYRNQKRKRRKAQRNRHSGSSSGRSNKNNFDDRNADRRRTLENSDSKDYGQYRRSEANSDLENYGQYRRSEANSDLENYGQYRRSEANSDLGNYGQYRRSEANSDSDNYGQYRNPEVDYDDDYSYDEEVRIPSGMRDINTPAYDDYDIDRTRNFSDMMEASSLKNRDTKNLDHFYREEINQNTRIFSKEPFDEEPEEDYVLWPDELSENLVGHWQDGVWVTTKVNGPDDLV